MPGCPALRGWVGSVSREGDFRPARDKPTMTNNTTPLAMICCLALAATLGCSNKQPTAPSSVSSPPPVGAAGTSSAGTASTPSTSRFGNRTVGVVYVTSQKLYYDTVVVKDPIPMEGRFQLLTNGQTEVGPGQPGYLGGRWWEDTNGNGVQDSADHFFLCPLLPPGRSTP